MEGLKPISEWSAQDHITVAHSWLKAAEANAGYPNAPLWAAMAQVHATLAVAKK